MTSPGSQDRRAVARGRLARVPATAAADVLVASAGIARSLAARESDIVRSMTSLLAHDIDQLDEDPVLVELLEASVHGNVSTIIHVLANDRTAEPAHQHGDNRQHRHHEEDRNQSGHYQDTLGRRLHRAQRVDFLVNLH